MDQQEFKNLVGVAITKLEKQGSPSRGVNGVCKYLSHENNCCIVGHMMPNDDIRFQADNDYPSTLVRDLRKSGMEWFNQFTDDQIDELSILQYYHDNITTASPHTFSDGIEKMKCLYSGL
jgi:hypothetical protein